MNETDLRSAITRITSCYMNLKGPLEIIKIPFNAKELEALYDFICRKPFPNIFPLKTYRAYYKQSIFQLEGIDPKEKEKYIRERLGFDIGKKMSEIMPLNKKEEGIYTTFYVDIQFVFKEDNNDC